ncbi:MAG TPA: hypothetical protein DCO89_01405 [Clostridiales bacterium]|nr:hypothetical protein [Clostridiales bacterium]
MKIEEKNWCRTLLVSYSHLETICGAIDKTVLNCGLGSCNTYCDAEYVANKMINLIDRKKFLINLKVLIDNALSKIKTSLARVLMLKYVDGVDSKLASEIMKISTRTYFRQINAGLDSLWSSLEHLGYNALSLYELLKNENWILEIYESYNKKDLKEEEIQNLSFLGMAINQYKHSSALAM